MASVEVVIKHATSTTGEGPHWDSASKSLYFVDIQAGDVHRWDSETKEDVKKHIGMQLKY